VVSADGEKKRRKLTSRSTIYQVGESSLDLGS
jgi:hypothetical protein